MKNWIKESYDPLSFAYVMATAVLSSALYQAQWFVLSTLFLFLALIGYVFLIFLIGKIALANPRQAFKKIDDTQNLFKLLSFCAGTTSLAARFGLAGFHVLALTLCLIGITATFFLIYAIFSHLLFHENITLQSMSALWLLMPIASHSAGISISILRIDDILQATAWDVAIVIFWAFGVCLYGILMALNIYRMFFIPFKGEDLNPSLWTYIGAAAIAVFDSAQFLQVANPPAFLAIIKPFLQGMVLLLWAWGTAWIPILCLMTFWKYAYFKTPFYYQPSLWAMVFPFGMYTLATRSVSTLMELNLEKIIPFLLGSTLFVWLLTAYAKLFIKQESSSF